MNPRPFILAGLCLLVAACVFPTEACGCTPLVGIATVTGMVQRADGSPAAGALVRTSQLQVPCGAEPYPVETSYPAVVRADGWYRHSLMSYSPSDSACVTLTALDTAGGRRDSAVVTGLRVRLVANYGTRERPESLRVDFRFRDDGARTAAAPGKN